MDALSERYAEARIEGVEQPFVMKGSIRAILPRFMMWLSESRSGRITLEIDTKPIRATNTADELLDREGVLVPPDPLPTDNWDSYYATLVDFFDGADSLALWLANEAFEQPQVPWLDDQRAARFIHMNASTRLYQRADPQEYAELRLYVEGVYPALFDSITMRG